MSDIVISLNDVSKVYPVWDSSAARSRSAFLVALEAFLPTFQATLRQFRRRYDRDFVALKRINLQIGRGESVAIIGKNGSGKSTLLQLVAGTVSPSSGSAVVNGRCAALLELGSGFNPEFTGRENILLNASLLGIPAEHIRQMLPQIERFADVGDFIHQPVKTYSSGMLMRVAFSVQLAIAPDILIVDEALSVGDMFFESKCIKRVKELIAGGTTLLFVSHSLQTVRSVCTRGILLSEGSVIVDGDIRAATDAYMKGFGADKVAHSPVHDTSPLATYESRLQPKFASRVSDRHTSGRVRFVECALFVQGRETISIRVGDSVEIVAWVQFHESLEMGSEVGIVVSSISGPDVFVINTHFNGLIYPPRAAGASDQLRFTFICRLAPGKYVVSAGFKHPIQGQYEDKVFGAALFEVVPEPSRPIGGYFDAQGEVKWND